MRIKSQIFQICNNLLKIILETHRSQQTTKAFKLEKGIQELQRRNVECTLVS